jgi:two-component system OmpR family response regulator
MSRSIAIVEDEPAIRANYADHLKRLGFEVWTYASRADASQAFGLRLPDLVLIDIGLGDESRAASSSAASCAARRRSSRSSSSPRAIPTST